jgi:hypothetical protein
MGNHLGHDLLQERSDPRAHMARMYEKLDREMAQLRVEVTQHNEEISQLNGLSEGYLMLLNDVNDCFLIKNVKLKCRIILLFP